MIFLTGDTHGQFQRIYDFCLKHETRTEDVMVILGDVGFNYFLDSSDNRRKNKANKQPITWFCIKGNHEKYAGEIVSYEEQEAFGGVVYVEPDYPNILFAKDGEVYTFIVDDVAKKVLVIGGAYSVDKYYRLGRGMNWFDDEQPSEETKAYVEGKIEEYNGVFDYIFTHTCPYSFMPVEWFLGGIDQSTVDNSTEHWLDDIYLKLDVNMWYCGHYHGSKLEKNVRFMFEDYVELGK